MMRAWVDYLIGTRGKRVTLAMPLEEFREHVEWLESLDPSDGCTRAWRAELDRVDPSDDDESDLEHRGREPGDLE